MSKLVQVPSMAQLPKQHPRGHVNKARVLVHLPIHPDLIAHQGSWEGHEGLSGALESPSVLSKLLRHSTFTHIKIQTHILHSYSFALQVELP